MFKILIVRSHSLEQIVKVWKFSPEKLKAKYQYFNQILDLNNFAMFKCLLLCLSTSFMAKIYIYKNSENDRKMVSCINAKDFLETVEGSIKLETKNKILLH